MLIFYPGELKQEMNVAVDAAPASAMIKRYYLVNPKNIAIIQFIIEGYEGMATVTTVDPVQACMRISIVETRLDDFEALAEDLRKTFGMEERPFLS